MSNNRIRDTYAEAYITGAKAEFYILLLKVEHMEKGSIEYNEFACERYAVKVLLDLATNSLEDQQKKDQLQALITHVLNDTSFGDLNDAYQRLEQFTI